MKKLTFGLAIASLVLTCSANAFAQRLIYRVDVKNAQDHHVDVSLRPVQLRPMEMTFQMPVSAPGVYSDVHYGRFVKNFKAFDLNGKELKVERVNDDRWKILNSENIGEIKYQVEDSHNDGSGPMIGMAKIDGDGLLANSVALFGYVNNDKGIPLTVSFSLPDKWMIATPLEPATDAAIKTVQLRLHQTIYSVDDYEELADAPVLAAPNAKRVVMWRDGAATYYVVNAGNPDFPIDSFAMAAKRISKIETNYFKNTPYEDYMFLVYNQDASAPSLAIPHASSSVYALHGTDWSQIKGEDMHLLATTLFQTWNGRRFHVSSLGPVDYSGSLNSQSLWFNEGVSDYFGDMLLARNGLTPPSTFFTAIDNWSQSVEQQKPVSLEALSTEQQHYSPALRQALRNKGALAALMMDIAIRTRSNNKKSLDNVLLKMNSDVAKGKTYDDKLLYQTIGEYATIDMQDFYNRYIAGTEPMPLETYLNKMGASREIAEGPFTSDLGFDYAMDTSGRAIISTVAPDPDLAIKSGDTILSINGQKVTPAITTALRSEVKPGQTIKLQVLRNRKPTLLSIQSQSIAAKTKRVPVMVLSKTTTKQLAMRKAMLGKNGGVEPRKQTKAKRTA